MTEHHETRHETNRGLYDNVELLRRITSALMDQLVGGAVTVHAAGTQPAESLHPQAAESVNELGIDITGEHPESVGYEVLHAVDLVIGTDNEAKAAPGDGTRSDVWDRDVWDTGAPSGRGIEGMDDMRRVRDETKARLQRLYAQPMGN
ncbi:low molecular weight phosphatase family protein [Arthrobacter sp. AL08]|uniref:arsenate-mycothiol transferase ArsC n=1 Tax=unclassified Arthrobacter TaxID=235627 RepID=UPI00249B38B5|nr:MULTISPECIES: low molecular weight phosphatase family protein [unclassified Arthrobacter]MDI3243469.1 low molecular weight phosphatase family protein [Arthrobacter sp. AL05]MDI3279472.1 low molecular weight phosphatase family protein [Arthrobacter sp. AL08]